MFVSAGAGTGKTAVLVERVLRRLDAGTAIDRILVITFTERAASELKQRVREALIIRGDAERARQVDSAWISTIHRFCMRLLHAHAIEAGLDPRFAVADEVQSRILQSEAFDLALEGFLAEPGDAPPRPARGLLSRPPAAASGGGVRAPAKRRRRACAAGAPRARHGGRRRRRAGRRSRARPRGRRRPGGVSRLPAGRRGAARPEPVCDPRHRSLQALQRRPPRSRERGQGCHRGRRPGAPGRAAAAVPGRVPGAPRPPLAGRLRRSRAACPRPAARAAGGRPELPRALRRGDGGRVPGHQPAAVRADRPGRGRPAVPGRRRVPVDLPLPPRRRRGLPRAAGGRRAGRGRRWCATTGPDRTCWGWSTSSTGARSATATHRSWRRRAGTTGRRPTTGSSCCSSTSRRTARPACAGARPRRRGWRRGSPSWSPAASCRARWCCSSRPGRTRPSTSGRSAAITCARCATTGRGYYAQQQVADLLGYLRLLRNRYDDMALLTVLASPLVGIGNDGLLAVRQAAVKRPIFTAFERDELPGGAVGRRAAAGVGVRPALLAAGRPLG